MRPARPFTTCLAVCLFASPAIAQDETYPDLPFQWPGGAIHCVIVTAERHYVRCDLVGGKLSFTEPPEGCEGEWGRAFEVAELGEGRPLCVTDSVVDPEVQVMEPGYSHSRGGVACFSEPGGMTCMNAEAHGFTLTEDTQEVF